MWYHYFVDMDKEMRESKYYFELSISSRFNSDDQSERSNLEQGNILIHG